MNILKQKLLKELKSKNIAVAFLLELFINSTSKTIEMSCCMTTKESLISCHNLYISYFEMNYKFKL